MVLAVALGGALGAVTRYGASLASAKAFGTAFPWGTLLINVLGSLALGYLAVTMAQRAAPETVRALWTVGFLGALTTFSTFSMETVALWEAGYTTRALLYVGASVVLGVVGAALGAAWASTGGAAPA